MHTWMSFYAHVDSVGIMMRAENRMHVLQLPARSTPSSSLGSILFLLVFIVLPVFL